MRKDGRVAGRDARPVAVTRVRPARVTAGPTMAPRVSVDARAHARVPAPVLSPAPLPPLADVLGTPPLLDPAEAPRADAAASWVAEVFGPPAPSAGGASLLPPVTPAVPPLLQRPSQAASLGPDEPLIGENLRLALPEGARPAVEEASRSAFPAIPTRDRAAEDAAALEAGRLGLLAPLLSIFGGGSLGASAAMTPGLVARAMQGGRERAEADWTDTLREFGFRQQQAEADLRARQQEENRQARERVAGLQADARAAAVRQRGKQGALTWLSSLTEEGRRDALASGVLAEFGLTDPELADVARFFPGVKSPEQQQRETNARDLRDMYSLLRSDPARLSRAGQETLLAEIGRLRRELGIAPDGADDFVFGQLLFEAQTPAERDRLRQMRDALNQRRKEAEERRRVSEERLRQGRERLEQGRARVALARKSLESRTSRRQRGSRDRLTPKEATSSGGPAAAPFVPALPEVRAGGADLRNSTPDTHAGVRDANVSLRAVYPDLAIQSTPAPDSVVFTLTGDRSRGRLEELTRAARGVRGAVSAYFVDGGPDQGRWPGVVVKFGPGDQFPRRPAPAPAAPTAPAPAPAAPARSRIIGVRERR